MVRLTSYLCLGALLGAAASNSTSPVMTTASVTGLTKLEIVAVIVIPIVGVTTILLMLSLAAWCRKSRRKQESWKYFVDKTSARKQQEFFEEAKQESSGFDGLAYDRMDNYGDNDNDDHNDESHSGSSITEGVDNPNYKDNEQGHSSKNIDETIPDELTASVDVQVFAMAASTDASIIYPASSEPSQETATQPSIRKEVVEIIANQTSTSASSANQEGTTSEECQVVYSQRTAL